MLLPLIRMSHIITLPGVKITDKPRLDAAGVPLQSVALRATEAYLTQILKHGFFHADPHPGNVSVDVSNTPNKGRWVRPCAVVFCCGGVQ